MPILIDAALSEPPSSVACFRDVTLYSNCFIKKRVILEAPLEIKDFYWKWLKQQGAFDFIEDIVEPFSESYFSIRISKGNITVPCITAHNLHFILQGLLASQSGN